MGSVGAIFQSKHNTLTNLTPQYVTINGAAASTIYALAASVMPVACTFKAMAVNARITATSGTDTVTMTLVKNGVNTTMAATVTVNVIGATVQTVTTANPVSVVAGDTVSLLMTHTDFTPAVEILTAVTCQ